MTAHTPQKIFGGNKCSKFTLCKNTRLNQLLRMKYTISVFLNPEERLQIAQTTLTLFYVRLNHITLTTLLEMAGATFRHLGFSKILNCSFEKIFPQLFLQAFVNHPVSKQETHFNQRSANGIIFAGKPHAVVNSPQGVPNF